MTTPKSLSQKDSFLTSLYLLIDTWPKRGNSNGYDSKTRNDGYTLDTIPALYLPKELCCEGMLTKENDSWIGWIWDIRENQINQESPGIVRKMFILPNEVYYIDPSKSIKKFKGLINTYALMHYLIILHFTK